MSDSERQSLKTALNMHASWGFDKVSTAWSTAVAHSASSISRSGARSGRGCSLGSPDCPSSSPLTHRRYDRRGLGKKSASGDEATGLQLPERYAAQVRALLREHIPSAQVWAYGSRVRGDHYDASDLDLVARFPPGSTPDLFRLVAVTEAFRDSALPIFVQILDWDRIPESFRDEIQAAYVVVQPGAEAMTSGDPVHGDLPPARVPQPALQPASRPEWPRHRSIPSPINH